MLLIKKNAISCSLLILSLSVIFIRCSSSNDPTAADCSSLTATIVSASTIQPTSCSEPNGSLTVSASGGTEPYQFSINGTTFQSSPQFNGLGAGSYSLTVKDASGCIKVSASVQLTNPNSNLLITNTQVNTSGCKTNNGSIAISVTGGVEPYTYSLNGINFSSQSTIEAVGAGTYTVTVKDANQCTTTKNNVKVQSGVSYDLQVKSIIQTSCVKSGCHNGGNSLPNFGDFNVLQANAADVKVRVNNGSMPKDGTLTTEQKNLISCWVDDGALNN